MRRRTASPSRMGGRIAEELVFGQMTTGAATTSSMATDLARKMVCEWGMSEKLGPLHLRQARGARSSSGRDFGDAARTTRRRPRVEIDAEVRTHRHRRATSAPRRSLAEQRRAARSASPRRCSSTRRSTATTSTLVLGGGSIERRPPPAPPRAGARGGQGEAPVASSPARRSSRTSPKRRSQLVIRALSCRGHGAGGGTLTFRRATFDSSSNDRHGRPQRHARFVLRRRRTSTTPPRRSRTAARSSPRAPTSSTSAASRRARARRRCSADEEARARAAGRARARRRASRVSVDTYKAEVAGAALAAGAEIVNDVSGGRLDPELLRVVAAHRRVRRARAPARHAGTRCTTHARYTRRGARGGAPSSPSGSPPRCAAGVARARVLVDPGLGFGKTRRAQPRAARAPRRAARARLPDRGRRVAQVVPRRAHRARRRRRASWRRPPPTRARDPARRQRACASTTSRAQKDAIARRRRDRARAQRARRCAHDARCCQLFAQPDACARRLVAACDILIVYYVIYRTLLLIKGTRAAQMLIGIVLVGAGFFAAKLLELTTLSWLLDNLINYSIIFFIVIFQHDIRRGLMRVGQNLFIYARPYEQTFVFEEVIKATERLAHVARRRAHRARARRRPRRLPRRAGRRDRRQGLRGSAGRRCSCPTRRTSCTTARSSSRTCASRRRARSCRCRPTPARQGARHAPPRRHRRHRGDRRGRRRRVRGARLDLALLRRQHRARPRRARRCARRCSACSRSRSAQRGAKPQEREVPAALRRRCRRAAAGRPRSRSSSADVAAPPADARRRERKTPSATPRPAGRRRQAGGVVVDGSAR